jgi:two-component system LytT family response regulator
MISTVILAEDASVRSTVRDAVTRLDPSFFHLAEATLMSDACEIIDSMRPACLIAEVKGLTGTLFDDVLPRLVHRPHVICLARTNDEAVRAFRHDCAHYLVLPLDELELADALSRVRRREGRPPLTVLREPQSPFPSDVVALPVLDGYTICNAERIVRIHGEGSYCRVVFHKEPAMTLTRTIGEYDALLAGAGFVRVHRSNLVNMRHIRRYIRGRTPSLVMSNGDLVEVSASYKETLMGSLLAPRRRK